VTTGTDFRLLRFAWDARAAAYRREVAYNPPDQWSVRHSNKYDVPDDGYIEAARERTDNQ
jgi:hypothetical protein